jgi:hypothetical protein
MLCESQKRGQSSAHLFTKAEKPPVDGESLVRRLFRQLIADTPMLWLTKGGICPLDIPSNVYPLTVAVCSKDSEKKV